ncbi:MAG: alkane 1-monooxygenase [Sulfitobacter sp.]
MTRHSQTISPARMARLSRALPYWMSLTLIPIAWVEAIWGGWTLILLPLLTWYLFALLDAVVGPDDDNADLSTSSNQLQWYRKVTLVWAPLQFLMLFGLIWYVPQATHLGTVERILLFFGVGIVTGTIGINYSHELMHQKSRFERQMADALLAMVLYSHFRSEHLLVHHRYVGTPRDAVTARYGEGFYRFYPRVLLQSFLSAFRAEKDMMGRKSAAWYSPGSPIVKYAVLQAAMLLLAFALGGWSGLALFFLQAGVAVWQLELVNYVEHYGLTRKHLGDGKYETVQPHHSWNATMRVSNWLLINLQRHSDHHTKPDRPYPVLQTYGPSVAPELPYGYAVMTMIAMYPPLWRRMMNPKVRKWRAMYYPEITQWQPYNKATNPLPR